MSSGDWSILGYPGDPIPGDPNGVYDAVGTFRATSRSLSTAATSLLRIEEGDNYSLAVTELVDNARDLAEILVAAFRRYDVAAGALDVYAGVLARARKQAQDALAAASQQQADYARSMSQVNQFTHQAKCAQTPAEQEQLVAAGLRAKSTADAAQGNLHLLRARVEQAIADRKAAGDQAAHSLDLVLRDKVLNDTAMDRFKRFAEEVASFEQGVIDGVVAGAREAFEGLKKIGAWVWDNIDTISAALTVIALATAWIPIVGQVAGLAALAAKAAVVVKLIAIAAKVASVISTVKSSAELFAAVSRGDWRAFAAAAATMTVSLALGRASKMATSAIAKSTKASLIKESVQETGSYSRANSALMSVPSRPSILRRAGDYFSGANPQSRKIDALVNDLKDTSSASAAGQIKLEGQIASQVVKSEKFMLSKLTPTTDYAPSSSYRMTQNSCPVPAGYVV